MKSLFTKHLLFLVLTVLFKSAFADQNKESNSESEYQQARNLIDSINYYFNVDQEKYNQLSADFEALEYEHLADSAFRQLIVDRTEFLRRKFYYQEAIPILTHSIQIAKEKNDTSSMALFYKMLSTHYFHTDKHDSANAQLNRAYNLYDYLGNKAELGIIDIRRARIAYTLGNYENAVRYSFKALELNEEAGDEQKMAISYLQLGNTYLYLANYKDSKKYFELASELFKRSNYDYGYFEAFSNIGLVDIKEERYRSGMSKQFAALDYFLSEEYSIDAGESYNFLTQGYFELQIYDSCLYYIALAKQQFEKSRYQPGLCEAYLNEVKVFFAKKQFERALTSALYCYNIATENSYTEIEELVNLELYKIYKALNNHQKSYQHLEQYVSIKDSLDFNFQSLYNDAMKYQLAAEEAQLEQQIAEERAQLQAERGKKTRQQLLVTIVVAIISLISLFVSIFYTIKNRKLNKSLSVQGERLATELKEKESLLSEIHHRVKNNLQVISSMLSLQTQYLANDPLKKLVEDCKGRITSMSLIHESLYKKQDFKEALFSSYIKELLPRLVETYGTDEGKIQLIMELEPIKLSLDESVPCGLIINEIITNSLKHGFPDGKEGKIIIELKQKGQTVNLNISDNGVGLEEDETYNSNDSFGFLLIEILASQLEAELTIKTLKGFAYHLKWESKLVERIS
ncbi:MAG: histidine kinase dimerization/phosphoacceptor domain -containing protein [Vicingaceae bacterium]